MRPRRPVRARGTHHSHPPLAASVQKPLQNQTRSTEECKPGPQVDWRGVYPVASGHASADTRRRDPGALSDVGKRKRVDQFVIAVADPDHAGRRTIKSNRPTLHGVRYRQILVGSYGYARRVDVFAERCRDRTNGAGVQLPALKKIGVAPFQNVGKQEKE